MPEGIIIKGIGGFYYVRSGDVLYECKARGIFRKNDTTPLPGDSVQISIVDDAGHKGSIDQILPRKSVLVRPAVANVTRVLAVFAVRSPQPDLMLLDKLLLTNEVKGLESIIVFNKCDLAEQDSSDLDALIHAYRLAGYTVVPAALKTGRGINEIRSLIAGHVTVFSGPSGVGKSTLLNALHEDEMMDTGEVSSKIERGRHTTRHAQLFPVADDGFILDTPGFSSFELQGITFRTLSSFYPEIRNVTEPCRFNGCFHVAEPDCAVKQAVAEGKMDGGRYERYTQIFTQLKSLKEW